MVGEIKAQGVGLAVDDLVIGYQKNGVEVSAAYSGKMPVVHRFGAVRLGRKKQVIFPEFACFFELRLPVIGFAVDAHRI